MIVVLRKLLIIIIVITLIRKNWLTKRNRIQCVRIVKRCAVFAHRGSCLAYGTTRVM